MYELEARLRVKVPSSSALSGPFASLSYFSLASLLFFKVADMVLRFLRRVEVMGLLRMADIFEV